MSWLADQFGPLGLVAWKVGLVGLTFAIGAVAVASTGLPSGVAGALLASAAATASFRFLERPFLTSLVALALASAAVVRFRQTAGRRALVVAALAPAIAVHLHAGGLDGLLIWLALLAGLALEWLLDRSAERKQALTAVSLHFVGLLVLVVAGLGLLAPAGLAVLTLPVRFSANAYWHEHLAEFRPLQANLPSLLPWLSVVLILGTAWRAARQRQLVEALILAGFAALAVRHVRMVWPMWAACLPVIAWVWHDWPGWQQRRWRHAAVALALPISAFGLWDQQQRFGLGLADRPGVRSGLAEARFGLPMLQLAGRLSGQVLVSDGLAGTWLWQVWRPQDPTRNQVLVHNCLECYRDETYINVYQKLRYGEPGWETTLAKYAIRSFALKHTSPGERRFQGGRPNLRQHLFSSARHVLVDFDDVVSVYSEAAALPMDVSALGAFPVDPDSGALRPGATLSQAVSALQAHATTHPHVSRSLWLAGKLLLSHGMLAEAGEIAEQLVRRAPEAPETEHLLALLRKRVSAPKS